MLLEVGGFAFSLEENCEGTNIFVVSLAVDPKYCAAINGDLIGARCSLFSQVRSRCPVSDHCGSR